MDRSEKISDLRAVIEEPVRSFYLERRDGAHLPISVHRIEPSTIHVGIPSGFTLERRVTGFLVAKGGGGIYRVAGELEGATGGSDVYDVAPLRIDLASVRFENRREFFRCRFENPPVALARSADGRRSFDVRVQDLSAGGVRIQAPSPLRIGEPLDVELTVALGAEKQDFRFRVKVVSDIGALYRDRREFRHTYGAWIVTPDRPSVEETRKLSDLQRRISRFCNDYVIAQRRTAREADEDPRA